MKEHERTEQKGEIDRRRWKKCVVGRSNEKWGESLKKQDKGRVGIRNEKKGSAGTTNVKKE